MSDRIREILSWYQSENPGVLTNLSRLLNHGRLGGMGRIEVLRRTRQRMIHFTTSSLP